MCVFQSVYNFSSVSDAIGICLFHSLSLFLSAFYSLFLFLQFLLSANYLFKILRVSNPSDGQAPRYAAFLFSR